jgi:hypothetical protein
MTKTEDGFRPLYDGRTLAGWDVVRDTLESWEAHPEGVITCNGTGRG